MRVTLSHDGRMATLATRFWSETIPAGQLAGRLNLYRRLRDRRGGSYADIYAGHVAAIEAAMRDLAGRAADPISPGDPGASAAPACGASRE